MTGTGFVVIGLGWILSWLGVNAETSQIAGWADSLVNIAGFIMVVGGQLKRSDLKWGIIRKHAK